MFQDLDESIIKELLEKDYISPMHFHDGFMPTNVLLKLYEMEDLGLIKHEIIIDRNSGYVIFIPTDEFKLHVNCQ